MKQKKVDRNDILEEKHLKNSKSEGLEDNTDNPIVSTI